MTQSLMVVSDLCLIPVIPGIFDMWAVLQTKDDVLKVLSATDDRLKARIILNQRDDRTSLTGEVAEAIREIGIPMMSSTIGQRVAWRRTSEGLTVWERNETKAKDELKNLVDEILELLI
jgi:cellulose biosynthesis protein BcsQ